MKQPPLIDHDKSEKLRAPDTRSRTRKNISIGFGILLLSGGLILAFLLLFNTSRFIAWFVAFSLISAGIAILWDEFRL